MLRFFLTVIALFAAAVPAWAAPEWLELSSPNFRLYTNARESEARHTLEYFEQVRDFFMKVKSSSLTTRLPVTIVLFRSVKDYRPYAGSEASAAYYVGDRSRDFIVLSDTGDSHYQTAVHEYMHLLVRHMELKVPIWLNEGIAQVYSTLKPYAGKIMVGLVPTGAGYALTGSKWLTAEQLFAVGHDSPEYNEKTRAGVFYSQSWMLTHMLLLDGRFSGKFGTFATLLSGGMSSADAFLKVYGMTPAHVAAEMRSYFASNSLKAALFDTRLQKMEIGKPVAAEAFAVELTLARLLMLLGRAEAKERLERLAAEQPQRWEAHETLAHHAWLRNDLTAAREHFRRATELQPKDWTVPYDYARLAAGEEENTASVISALQQSLRLNGNNIDARIMLGWEQYRAKNYSDALSVFATVRNVDAERAPRLFLGIGASAVQLERWDEARSAANQALKFAKEPSDRTQATSLLDYLDRRKKFEHEQRANASFAPVRPSFVEQRTDIPAEVRQNAIEVRGLLRKVDCMTTKARLHIAAGDREIALLIVNPDEVMIGNELGSTVTMICGPQPAGRTVTVEYVQRADAADNTVGDVKTIEFAATTK